MIAAPIHLSATASLSTTQFYRFSWLPDSSCKSTLSAVNTDEYVGIPQGKARMMRAALQQGMPSGLGTVFLAGLSVRDSEKGRDTV